MSNTKRDLRDILLALREKKGLTRLQLAEEMGTTYRYIWHCENSAAPKTIGTLEDYLDTLGAKLDLTVVQGKTTHRVAA